MNNDLFVYDAERFNKLASEETLKQGFSYFTEHRVLTLNREERSLIAQIADSETKGIQFVELKKNAAGGLVVQCNCSEEQAVCKHAIAVLHSYNHQMTDYKKRLNQAIDGVLKTYINKGQTEVRVKLVSGNLLFGIWQATAIDPTLQSLQSYQVYLRSLQQCLNYCTCHDWQHNRLGTCQHIEAVIHYAKSKSDYDAIQALEPPVSFAHLVWQDNQPIIRLHPISSMTDDLIAICADYFAQDKTFIGQIPHEFLQFAERVSQRDDFHLGEDVLRYIQQYSNAIEQNLRNEQISRDILNTHGVLPGLKARLFPYQTEGVAFLASRGRALLADDIGLGKTVQALFAAYWMSSHAGVRKVLVVCPTSLKYQWAREIKKFLAYKAQIIQGSAEQRSLQYQADNLFFVINYEVALRDLNSIIEVLKPDILILDEPQRSKNWQVRLTKLKAIISPYIFVLSSLALEQRLNDLYSLLQVVDEYKLGSEWRYLLDYQLFDDNGTVIGYRHLDQLHQNISSVMLRRRRNEVSTQLLEKTEVRLDVPLDKIQRALHDAAMLTATQLAQVATRRSLTPGEQRRLMEALQQARMACNAAGLVDKATQGSPKLHELSHLMQELCLQNACKVVIFSQWAAMTEMVETLVGQMGITCVRLHGGLSNEERSELVTSFQKTNSVQVVISTDVGGIGLSLKSAKVLINLDMPWNPAILDQRIARIYRLGQKTNIQVFSILTEDSYEQQITKLVKSKRDLFDNIISPEASDDVVGISKKMLQALIDALTVNAIDKNSRTLVVELTNTHTSHVASEETAEMLQTRQLLEKAHIFFHHRIERILGSATGLLVVVNALRMTDEDTAQQLSKNGTPVAVVDTKILTSLKRLQTFASLLEMPVLYEANLQTTVNPLTQLAQAKLHSASLLLAQKSNAGVLDLLVSAMLLQAAAIAGQFQAPTIDTVVVWLYNEILPQQLLTQEQADAILRVIALYQSKDVPPNLLEQALADAYLLCPSSC